MAESIDFDKIKQRAQILARQWKKKADYLVRSVKRFGTDGALYWLKSHGEIEQLESALEALNQQAENEDFNLLQVYTVFSSFALPEEDLEQASWYRNAHHMLQQFDHVLLMQQQFDHQKLKAIINELKFITQAVDFHNLYQLTPVQKKAEQLCLNLQQCMLDYQKQEASKQEHNEELVCLKEQEIEASNQRIAIDEEKKHKLAEKELLEAQSCQEMEKSEFAAQQVEVERKAKLQVQKNNGPSSKNNEVSATMITSNRFVANSNRDDDDDLATFSISYGYDEEKSKNKTLGKWIKSGEAITIKGQTITGGNFYYGGKLSSLDGYGTEASLVDDSLKIENKHSTFEDESLGYWPKFISLTPKGRGAFLSWLSSNRNDLDTPLGYVFIYFYGIERRITVDSIKQAVDDTEFKSLFDEVLRLKGIYGGSRSFSNYATRLLEIMCLLRPHAA